ncbi:uncharacterized protein BDR25DRAFT_347442 [Lindgomyces ingoldianus]|uniref:Uncharacterized protein n=1 Tax=Lindgomyces ingoldianus TaxID=673940 RepID=A0ACB6QA92_9PLEO|nr:uncharacterized protein BDR25DRAFT_347442 [Lindgomyces ingoldianus]KAF2463056.1 hypothetical protein BDR25DRAFT_347442 [Lindgomyces ingoldianus]
MSLVEPDEPAKRVESGRHRKALSLGHAFLLKILGSRIFAPWKGQPTGAPQTVNEPECDLFPARRSRILDKMKTLEEKKKDARMERLRDDIKGLQRNIRGETRDFCKLQCTTLVARFHASLPLELRYMVYDYLISDFRSEIGVKENDALYYRHEKFNKVAWGDPWGFIFRPNWVGQDVAKEAASYFYSTTLLRLYYTTQIEHFLINRYDIFFLGLDPKAVIRRLEIYIHYNRKAKDGYHSSGAMNLYVEDEISELRTEQLKSLEALLEVTHVKGFRLLLLVKALRWDINSRINALHLIEAVAPTLFRLKDAGVEISMMQAYGQPSDTEDCFAGWLNGTQLDFERRMSERRDELSPKPLTVDDVLQDSTAIR